MKRLISIFLAAAVLVALSAGVWAAQKGGAKDASSGAKWSKTVVLQTNRGDIVIKLMGDVAPKACENFVRLVRKGYYDGLTFHRVIKNFMIQGGDPNGNGTGGQSIWGRPFEDECRRDVDFGTVGLLAMANAGPGTNGSQFFITTSAENTRHLHGRHTIFGKVVGGMDVVRAIENCQTGMNDRPVKAQRIIKAYVKGDSK